MKNLEVLRQQIFPIPFYFAVDAEESDSDIAEDFDSDESDAITLSEGFKEVFSENPKMGGGGKYLLRADMNRIGEMSTREKLFRDSGGIHTFNQDVSDKFIGYPEKAVLSYDDGKYVKLVESQEPENTKSFLDDATSKVIDAMCQKDENDTIPRFLWLTASHLYGASEGLFKIGADFTRCKQAKIASNGNSCSLRTDEDSFVFIGASLYSKSNEETTSSDGVNNSVDNPKFSISIDGQDISLSNKGRAGYDAKAAVLMSHTIPFKSRGTWHKFRYSTKPLYPNPTYGSGNFSEVLLVKKGVVVRASLNGFDSANLHITAFPVQVYIEGKGVAE